MSKHSRPTSEQTTGSSHPPDAGPLDRLYAAPYGDFVALRKKVAAELRAAGNLELSRQILSARKPSRTAWVINQLARKSPDVLRAAFEAFDSAARAQTTADGDAMRETARTYRERVNGVVLQCERVLADAGSALGPDQARRVSETLRAGISGGVESRERLLSGRLTEDADVEDPILGLEVGAASGARQQERGRDEAQQGDRDRQRERELERKRELEATKAREARESAIAQARNRIAEIEAEARVAREAARAAEVAAARAQAEAERARRQLAAVEERLAKALAALHPGP